ncbi:winged helix-turn-helix domain-containing protein [Solibacillus isronensis]|uniref:winged helix-turn-helix domain-containing protein n=1 Tax=Solibacillus isronensis TaxID=412383 RepID=UPI00203AF464|nr:winged helix-turn-helix domain-containing protein [Solibacillus isronensis]MCM3723964.1 winged helix-turn-helix domain-containing protein [Solibacillus isronensis]
MLTKKELLLEKEDLWLSKEEDSDEWYEEGIQLYEKLSKVDSFNFAHYNKQQANLLLEKARNEKMHHGNMNRAESLLKRVIDLEPTHSEIYYRLAFINGDHEKWEAVLFYANEAFKYKLSEKEKIKLFALMGCAYKKIKLHHRGKEQFEHAEALDVKSEWTLFIEKYRNLADERRVISRQKREEREECLEEALQKTRENMCCILTLHTSYNALITSDTEVSLNPKEAELLSFLVLNETAFVSKSLILDYVWPEIALDNPNSTVVKRNISSLRRKLSQAFEILSGTDFIKFEENGYKLILSVPLQVFKGVDYRRISCR